MCVEGGSFTDAMVSTYYTRVQRVRVANSVSVMQGVASGLCDGGVMGIGPFQIYQMVSLFNFVRDLSQLGVYNSINSINC